MFRCYFMEEEMTASVQLLFRLILAYAMGTWAKEKGLGFGLFFAITFFLPLIGLLVVAFAKPQNAAPAEEAPVEPPLTPEANPDTYSEPESVPLTPEPWDCAFSTPDETIAAPREAAETTDDAGI